MKIRGPFAAFAALLAACSSSSTGGGAGNDAGGGGALTVDTFEAAYYRALCDALFQCPVGAGNDLGTAVAFLENPTVCAGRAARLNVAGVRDLLDHARAGRVRFDGAAAGECLARVSRLCSFDESDLAVTCRRAFTGTVASGGGCWRSEECVAGHFCDHGMTSVRQCPGTCRPQLAAGAMCSTARQCSGWDTGRADCTGTCVALQEPPGPAVEGQRCGRIEGPPAMQVACAAGLACAGGTCRRPVASGAPCAAGDACAPGTVCVQREGTTTRTCTAPASLVTSVAGGPCSASGRTAPYCNTLARLECGPAGTCMALGDGTMGARCLPGADFAVATCNAGLRCDATSRTCVPRAAAGAACQRDADCLSDECTGERCLERLCN